ncbi:MAG: M3 family oligoendopeptidase [Phycisphaerales bacterium]
MPATSDFVPQNLDATKWDNLQPLYASLLARELKCPNCLETLLLDRSELDSAASEARANLYINMTCHTNDDAIKKAYLDFIENVEPHLKKVGFELDRKIVNSPHAAKLDTDTYGVLLRDLKADVEIFRDENVALMTEDTKLDQKYGEVCGEMTVDFQGEERTLPQMAKFFEANDRDVREAAWRGVWDRRAQDRDTMDDILDTQIALRHKIAVNAGFDNYRDYQFTAMHRFDYTPEHCEAFHKAAAEVCVPVLRSLHAERAEALGVDTLRPWDLLVDIHGREPLRPFEGGDDLVSKSSRLFHRMDPSLGEMFDSMRGGDCLDLESRKGKAPGGYQYQRDRSRTPFIFMNAAGLQRDLETMVHEAGHAFHSLLSRDLPLLHYRHSPIEFAEVASMSMELTSHPFLDEFYSQEDAQRARRRHLEAMAQILPWIATIDAFQHWMYLHPDHSRDERTAYWNTLLERFGGGEDWTGLERFRDMAWQRQGHLFGVPFYYIEYGIAQLGALQLWLQYRNDPGSAIQNYKNALALGGSRPLPELFAAAELKFDFGPAIMSRLMNEVKGELATLPL